LIVSLPFTARRNHVHLGGVERILRIYLEYVAAHAQHCIILLGIESRLYPVNSGKRKNYDWFQLTICDDVRRNPSSIAPIPRHDQVCRYFYFKVSSPVPSCNCLLRMYNLEAGLQLCLYFPLQLPSLRQMYVDDFATKAELIDACMASAHIPFFLNGMPGNSFLPSCVGK